MALVVLCLSRRLEPNGRGWLIAGAVAWLAAFLVKETAIWCAPVWLYALVSDLRTRSIRDVARSYVPALLVGAFLLAAYLVLCVHLWGSALARFQGVEAISEEHAWSMHGKSSGAWLARLTWQPAWFVIGLFQCLLVPAIAAAWWVRGPQRIWAFVIGVPSGRRAPTAESGPETSSSGLRDRHAARPRATRCATSRSSARISVGRSPFEGSGCEDGPGQPRQANSAATVPPRASTDLMGVCVLRVAIGPGAAGAAGR
jgi:hypothetical protein